MKIIKQRAYYKLEDKMYHVVGINLENTGTVTLLSYGGGLNIKRLVVALSEVVILSLTGKTDLNNIDIYEGDLVTYGDKFQYSGLIVWDKVYLRWVIMAVSKSAAFAWNATVLLGDIYEKNIKIIGNKYQTRS